MTNKHLREIKARCDAAESGPWKVVRYGECVPEIFSEQNEHVAKVASYFTHSSSIDNAEFIAHAREDIPALLDRCQDLKDQLIELSDELDDSEDMYTIIERDRDNWKNRAKALEKAIYSNSDIDTVCFYCKFTPYSDACDKCEEAAIGEIGGWEFDEARFAKQEVYHDTLEMQETSE